MTPSNSLLAPVIAALPHRADAQEVTVSALEGGITNSNFLVEVGDEAFVARLPGRDTQVLGIDRATERRAAEAAATASVGPEVVAFVEEQSCLVTRFVRGLPLPPNRMQEPQSLVKVVAALKAFHSISWIPGVFSAFRVVEAYRQHASARGVEVPQDYEVARTRALEIEAAFEAAPSKARPCHNDLLNANFIDVGDRVIIVDYEYAGMGDVFFDLGNLSVNNSFSEESDLMLLSLYFEEVTPARVGRLKLMRMMSDFREAMWGVVQQALSTLDFDYRAYSSEHFARFRTQAEDPRYPLWVADAARPVE